MYKKNSLPKAGFLLRKAEISACANVLLLKCNHIRI